MTWRQWQEGGVWRWLIDTPCPRCGAAAGDICQTYDGRDADPHMGRVDRAVRVHRRHHP